MYISGKDVVLFASVGIGTAALVIALLSIKKSFQFNQDLQPTLSGSFTVGTSDKGIAGIWFGSQPTKLFLDSLSNHFIYGTQSLTTFADLDNQSYTTQQYIQNQSFSQVQGLFKPSVATFYSTENQFMGLVTATANLSSASAFYYNHTGLSTDDIYCSTTQPSAGGNSLSGDSKIIVRNTGIYKIGTSIQFDQTANQVNPVGFWLRINGVDVPETGSIQTIIQANGETVPYMEYITSLTSNSNFEIMWKSFDLTTFAAKFTTAAGLGSSSNVNSPSIITNIYRIA